jgi:hypothetical protein
MPEGTHFPALLDDAEFALILAGDDLDELRELHDRLSDQLGAVKARLWELEQAAGNPELREQRRDYYASR